MNKKLDFSVRYGRLVDAGQCSKAGEKVSKTIWQSSILWPRAKKNFEKPVDKTLKKIYS